MLTLKELSKETVDYLLQYRDQGGTCEFDGSINDISRAIIEAMKREKGKCFLGKVNLYGDERKKEYHLVEYTGQKVYNFEYSFCLPCHDSEIERMIEERDKAPYTGTKEDYTRVTAITERIFVIGGTHLFWA